MDIPPRQNKVRHQIIKILKKARSEGIPQKELELNLGISKSYCSELLSELEQNNLIIRDREAGLNKRIYHAQYYPAPLQGFIRVGLLRSSEYVLFISSVIEVFKESQKQINFRFYNSTFEITEDLVNGSLDLIAAPTATLVLSAVTRNNIRVLSGVASGGSGILKSKNQENDSILTTETSSMAFMVRQVLLHKEAGSIEPFGDPRKAVKRFLAENYSMIAIWEPFYSELRRMEPVTPLLEYNDFFRDFPCCSLAANSKFLELNSGIMQRFLTSYGNKDALDEQTSSSDKQSVRLVASATGISPERVMESLKNYNFTVRKIKKSVLLDFGMTLTTRQIQKIFLDGVLI
ncbi:MAG: hypothetical protein M1476_00120 [Candidatus Thermoplasmatota archaeon]|nr:hypothetical protein [Candidatus Thermoplasmatota archaeon]